jgi:hypothetical protein
MKRSLAAILCAAPLLMAVPALAQPMPQTACLQPNRIRDFDPQPDNRTIIVTDSVSRKYRVTLQFPCLELKYRMSLAFRSMSGSRLQCLERNDRVIAGRGQGLPSDRCLIDTVTAYTPAMEKADKAARAMDRPH